MKIPKLKLFPAEKYAGQLDQFPADWSRKK